MRKRAQYRKDRLQTKVSTLIIMIIMLVAILAFGKSMSNGIASFFAPNVPVKDQPVVAVSDVPGTADNHKKAEATQTGTVVHHAWKAAAQNILNILSQSGKH